MLLKPVRQQESSNGGDDDDDDDERKRAVVVGREEAMLCFKEAPTADRVTARANRVGIVSKPKA